MIEEINSIKNQNTFKKSLFRGTIFKFSNSKNAIKIVDTIKKEVQNYYSNNLESLHLEKHAELISKDSEQSVPKGNKDFYFASPTVFYRNRLATVSLFIFFWQVWVRSSAANKLGGDVEICKPTVFQPSTIWRSALDQLPFPNHSKNFVIQR